MSKESPTNPPKLSQNRRVKNDLMGRQFDKWTVIAYEGSNNLNKSMWRCLCECGNQKVITSQVLTGGKSRSCGCQRFYRDLMGQRFGRWTVVSLHTAGKRYRWNVICDCGNTSNVFAFGLTMGNSLSCGCLNKERSSLAHWKGYKDMSGHYFHQIKASASIRKVPFNLTIQEAYALLEAQDFVCPYTGAKLCMGDRRNYGKTLSLDRIDSSLPYSVANCEWIAVHLNSIKGSLSKRDFITLASYVANPITGIEVRQQTVSVKFWAQKHRAMIYRDGSTDIQKSDLQTLIDSQHSQCAITGYPLVIPPNSYPLTATNASIDRIDSSLGYVKSNIQFVDKRINLMKLDYSSEEFLNICKEVNDYQNAQ